MDSPESADADIRETIDGWLAALNAKDAASVAGHYGAGAVTYSLAPPLVEDHTGPDSLEAWFPTWDGSLDNGFHDLTIAVSGDVAFAHGVSHLRGVKIGEGPVELWFRQTLGLRRIGDAWKIVHEHASVPFYMDGSMRAAVDLKPRHAAEHGART